MTKASDNVFPKLIESMQTSDPTAPSDSSWKIYAKAPGIYARSSNAIVGPFGTGGAGGTTLASAAYKRTSGDYTMTSTTFQDIDSTNMALTITTGAHRVLIGLIGTWEQTSSSDNAIWDFTVDGTRVGGTLGILSPRPSNSAIRTVISFTYLTDVLSAASHTFKAQWRTLSTGTITLHGSSADSECQFYVMEQGG